MTQYTENYLILKPIAERFSRVSSEISDDDIKYIIKQVMKEKISDALDFSVVQEKLIDWIDNNSDQIVHAMQDAIMKRFDLPKDYSWLQEILLKINGSIPKNSVRKVNEDVSCSIK